MSSAELLGALPLDDIILPQGRTTPFVFEFTRNGSPWDLTLAEIVLTVKTGTGETATDIDVMSTTNGRLMPAELVAGWEGARWGVDLGAGLSTATPGEHRYVVTVSDVDFSAPVKAGRWVIQDV